jgi:multimeric flavodoxin WrbA
MKKILVLTGSPRKNGNSDLMAEAFIKGAQSAGNEILKFSAGNKDIKGCKACNTCFSKGKACSFDDDFNELAPMLEKADALVIATPIYYYSFPSEIKAAIDKLYAYAISGRELKIKESMLFVCGETDKESDFDGIIKSYELIADFDKWQDRGHVVATSVNNPGDITKTDILADIEQLGMKF